MLSDLDAAPPAVAAALAAATAAGTWNNRKSREEYDMYKSRLQDQRFSIADYPDPLSPRPPHPKQYPKGTDPKLEQMLHELIAKVKQG
ncbi:hypothetical protein C8A05DRAFT_12419 [Staphylotrichum tortipilum]|uniref:Uncharacterized protein n=1 Tax=Staphylotrichum tortipilum TaxID=2831512 RepID=A0AAN6MSX4_9PEZI|nr:hypothetical protein C8A05DRAFT_12419 [Staphylotrichum longicolle]